ncbi:hypothetical protein K431DRAFT_310326 [Polychaeton citri CBS 116435]|uniref:Uncharacterized protein n=1 Tax=Polychaeton citri CBS 116435 TaxID=1314669 RepID=A0A9P4QEI3_9PEZI|nr:hypothetical protein K431DRAFT_310326 [Polychaeton citri CBS 116435]
MSAPTYDYSGTSLYNTYALKCSEISTALSAASSPEDRFSIIKSAADWWSENSATVHSGFAQFLCELAEENGQLPEFEKNHPHIKQVVRRIGNKSKERKASICFSLIGKWGRKIVDHYNFHNLADGHLEVLKKCSKKWSDWEDYCPVLNYGQLQMHQKAYPVIVNPATDIATTVTVTTTTVTTTTATTTIATTIVAATTTTTTTTTTIAIATIIGIFSIIIAVIVSATAFINTVVIIVTQFATTFASIIVGFYPIATWFAIYEVFFSINKASNVPDRPSCICAGGSADKHTSAVSISQSMPSLNFDTIMGGSQAFGVGQNEFDSNAANSCDLNGEQYLRTIHDWDQGDLTALDMEWQEMMGGEGFRTSNMTNHPYIDPIPDDPHSIWRSWADGQGMLATHVGHLQRELEQSRGEQRRRLKSQLQWLCPDQWASIFSGEDGDGNASKEDADIWVMPSTDFEHHAQEKHPFPKVVLVEHNFTDDGSHSQKYYSQKLDLLGQGESVSVFNSMRGKVECMRIEDFAYELRLQNRPLHALNVLPATKITRPRFAGFRRFPRPKGMVFKMHPTSDMSSSRPNLNGNVSSPGWGNMSLPSTFVGPYITGFTGMWLRNAFGTQIYFSYLLEFG